MKRWYKDSGKTIGVWPCIEDRETGMLVLVGKYGQIWPWGGSSLSVLIQSTRVAKKYAPKDKKPVQVGDETLLRVPIEELDKWCQILKIFKYRAAQLERANRFGES